MKYIVPAGFAAAAAVGAAWQLAGHSTSVNATLGISLAVAVPAAIAKILWDAYRSRNVQKRLRELEDENRQLKAENVRLQKQLGTGS